MFRSSTTKAIAGNTLYQIFGKVLSMSITVLTTVIVTRAYGRVGYGEFSIMQNWPALFFVIVDFGINAIVVRELTRDFTQSGKYLGNVLILRILFSGAIILCLALALLFFPYSHFLRTGILLSLFLVLTQALYTTTNIVFQVKLRYDLSTLGYISGYILIFILVLLFSFFKADLRLVSFAYVLGGVLTFVLNYYFLKKLDVVLDLRWAPQTVKSVLAQALPLGLMFLFSQISFKADSILLSLMDLPENLGLSNTESVALYSLPYKVFEVALVIPTFFMNSVYPVLVRHLTESKDKLKATFLRSMTFLFVAAIVASGFGVLLSPLAISFLGGTEFEGSTLVLQILICGLVFYYLTQPLAWLIVTIGKQKYLPYIYFISALFNFTANLVFIPRYSFYASAVITHVSEALILVMLSIVAVKSWKELRA